MQGKGKNDPRKLLPIVRKFGSSSEFLLKNIEALKKKAYVAVKYQYIRKKYRSNGRNFFTNVMIQRQLRGVGASTDNTTGTLHL